MKNCVVTVTLNEAKFVDTIPIDQDTPEYVLADEAWKIALLFAQTQAIANMITPSNFAAFLEGLDYKWEIAEAPV